MPNDVIACISKGISNIDINIQPAIYLPIRLQAAWFKLEAPTKGGGAMTRSVKIPILFVIFAMAFDETFAKPKLLLFVFDYFVFFRKLDLGWKEWEVLYGFERKETEQWRRTSFDRNDRVRKDALFECIRLL